MPITGLHIKDFTQNERQTMILQVIWNKTQPTKKLWIYVKTLDYNFYLSSDSKVTIYRIKSYDVIVFL